MAERNSESYVEGKVIQLTTVELMVASTVGAVRRITGIKEGLNKNKHAEKSDWQTDIDGAAAEMAYAKAHNVYWGGLNRAFKAPDVGDIQIRSTSHDDGHLIIRPDDSDDEQYALVITNPPFFKIIGAMLGRDAKQDRYWRSDAWWVPQKIVAGKMIDG